MDKRSLTLIETLIALVLVVALGALVFPVMINTLEERAFESAADVTNEQLMLARAHAQATGSAVEVTYNAQTAQVQARLFAPWPIDFSSRAMEPGTSPLAPRARDSAVSETLNQENQMTELGSVENRQIPEAWACRDLAQGLRIRSRPPIASNGSNQSDDRESSDVSDDSANAVLDELLNGQEVRLAVFMPDGTAMLGGPVWLNDESGRCGKFSINPWSGLPIFQRLADIDADNPDAVAQADDTADRRRNDKARGNQRADEDRPSVFTARSDPSESRRDWPDDEAPFDDGDETIKGDQ